MQWEVSVCAMAGLLLAGCASSSAEVQPAYVSPLQYQSLTCSQIGAEAERVSRRVAEVSGVQDNNRSNDAWATAGAIVIFWPAAFFIKGDGPTGEFETLERVANEKNCNLQFRPQTTASIPEKKT